MNRLFLPMNKEPYLWVKDESKTYEMRKYLPRYNEEHVCSGRKVELRLGYSGESTWKTIGKVEIGTLSEIFSKLNFKTVIPTATSKQEVKQSILNIMGEC